MSKFYYYFILFFYLGAGLGVPKKSQAQTITVANEVVAISEPRSTGIFTSTPTAINPQNATVNNNQFARLQSSPGLALGLGSFTGFIDLRFPSLQAANTTSYVRLRGEDSLLESLLGGSLGQALADIGGLVLLGNQVISLEARNEAGVVFSRNSGSSGGGFNNPRSRVVADAQGNLFVAFTPDQPYTRIRATNDITSLLGLGNIVNLDVFSVVTIDGIGACGSPQFTSFDASGINLDLLGLGSSGVTNPGRAIDGDINTFSSLSPGLLSVGGTISQFFEWGSSSVATDEVQVTLSGSPAVLNVDLLGGIRLVAYNQGNVVFNQPLSALNTELLGILQLDLLGLLSGGDPVTFPVRPGVPFDRFEVRVGSLLNVDVGEAIRIHEVVKTAGRPLFADPAAQNQVLCAGENAIFSVIQEPNTTYQWFDRPVGGTAIASGATFNAGPISARSVFYVSATRADCSEPSVRAAVTADVDLNPTITVAGATVFTAGLNDTVTLPAVSATDGAGNPVPVSIIPQGGAPFTAPNLAGPFTSGGQFVYRVQADGPNCTNFVDIIVTVIDFDDCPAVFTPNFANDATEFTTSSLLGIQLGSVTNANNAADGNLSTFSVLSETLGTSLLGLTGETSQTLGWNVTRPAGSLVTVKLARELAGVAQVAAGIYVQPFRNGVAVGPRRVVDGNLVSVLNGVNEFNVNFVPTAANGNAVSFDAVKVGLLPLVNLLQTVRVYGAYTNDASASAPVCDFGVFDVLTGFETGLLGLDVVTGLTAVLNPERAVDGNLNTFATIVNAVGVNAFSKLEVAYRIPAIQGDSLRIKIGVPAALLELSLLDGFRIQRFLGNQAVGAPVALNGSLISLRLLAGNNEGILSLATDVPFDRIQILSGGLVSALEALRVFDVSIVPTTRFENEVLDPATGLGILDICPGEELVLPTDCDGVKLYTAATGSDEITVQDIAQLPAGTVLTVFVQPIRFGCETTTERRELQIRVRETPLPILEPAGANVLPLGAPITLRVANAGDFAAGTTYEWFQNGVLIPAVTGPELSIPAFSAAQVGSFTVRALSTCPSELSLPVDLLLLDLDFWKGFEVSTGNLFVQGGEEVTYFINIRNQGSVPLSGLIIRDAIPENTAFVTGSASDGGALIANELVWTNVDVPAGGTRTLTFRVRVEANLSGVNEIFNIARLQLDPAGPAINSLPPNALGDGPDIGAPEGTIIPVEANPNLAAWKAFAVEGDASATQVGPNQLITYTIFVRNLGNQNLTNVRVSDRLPAGVSYVSGGTLAGDVVSFTVGNLQVGETKSVTFSVRTNQNLTNIFFIENTAEVRANGIPDPILTVPPVDNQDPLTSGPDLGAGPGTRIPVLNNLDIAITKLVSSSDPSGSAVAGATLTYTITVRNTGSVDLERLFIRDPLPANTIFLSATDDGSVEAGEVRWVFEPANLAVGQSREVSFTVEVGPIDSSVIGQISNIAFATATGLITDGPAVDVERQTPPVTINTACAPSTAADIDADAGAICPGESFDLNPRSTTVANPIFRIFTDASLSPSSLISGTVVSPTVTTTYFITVEGDGVCQTLPGQALEVTLTVNPSSTAADITADGREICLGEPTELTASSALTNPIFRWYTDAGLTQLLFEGATFTPASVNLGANRFFVTVAAEGICETKAGEAREVVLTVNERPATPVVSPTAITLTEGFSAAISASVGAGEVAVWFDANGQEVFVGEVFTTPTTLPIGTFTFSVFARNTTTQCLSENAATVTVTIVPRDPNAENCTIANAQSGGSTLLCVLCSITNAERAVDGNPDTFSRLNIPAGLLSGSVFQNLFFPTQGAAGDSVRVRLAIPGGLADVSVLGGVQLQLLQNGSLWDRLFR
ncbi:hypothetical protein A3SI_16712 [Nitritalea halalkaliphila LW7]|uniref:Uncharacterized protein n=1 Tax=Nitritalea halalkaliphila LW7 TaxID=1189621 RepID=I5BWT3_9BACT|nr:DUF11 domain-containing protein [Nitritalea halalkaliphila]EIM74035.1 hypothetical protein A3SI_16712 [Nitritalea halalkaliphila LW7]